MHLVIQQNINIFYGFYEFVGTKCIMYLFQFDMFSISYYFSHSFTFFLIILNTSIETFYNMYNLVLIQTHIRRRTVIVSFNCYCRAWFYSYLAMRFEWYAYEWGISVKEIASQKMCSTWESLYTSFRSFFVRSFISLWCHIDKHRAECVW